MGEIFLCQECHQRVDLATDEYVVSNKATARTKSQWVYSHAKCVEDREPFTKKTHAEMEEVLHRMLETRIGGMDAEALRRLGLQRIEGDPRGPKSGAQGDRVPYTDRTPKQPAAPRK